MEKKVYQQLASSFNAMQNCEKSGNNEWYYKHEDTIHDIEKNNLPSGSGIDSGTQFDFDKSTDNKLVLNSSYHCMDEFGYYDGWIDFTVTVKPSLIHGLDINISGRFSDRNGKYADLKDYLLDTFYTALTEIIK